MKWPWLNRSLLACLLASLLQGSEYTVIDLGPGEARGLNNAGVVVGFDDGGGFHYDSSGRQPTPPLAYHDPGFTTNLVGLQWQSINDAGQRVGSALVPNSKGYLTRRVVIWNGSGDPTVLPNSWDTNPNFPDTTAYPVAINSSGNVTGGNDSARPFVYINGQMDDLRNYRIQWSFDLNDANAVAVGFPDGSWVRPSIWKNGEFTQVTLPDPPGDLTPVISYGTGINNTGQVAGNIGDWSQTYSRGFLWTQGVTEFIDVPGGVYRGNYLNVFDLNEGGVVVGQYRRGSGPNRAFIYRHQVMTDLNTLIPDNGWQLTAAYRLNESNQIVGAGIVNGKPRAFLLKPLNPELGIPPTIVSNLEGGRFGLGESTTLGVVAHGSPPLVYQWFRNGTNLVGERESKLILTSMDAGDTGVYSVVVRNQAGEAFSKEAVITVLDPEIGILRFAGVAVTGAIGGVYEIQSSPSYTSPQWNPLTRITLTQSPQVWIDPESGTNSGPRFYRSVRILP